jgi:sulfoxide reductase heme-binding subunit YedZ
VRLLKPGVFALALAPFLYLLFRAFTDRLSANPIEDITLTTGIWSLRFLLVTLAVTPLRRLSGWHRVIQYRRMLGLFAFFYAVLHVATFVVLDHFFDFSRILADVVKRPFITAGSVAFLAMVPLALTSTRGWIRRLGRRWQLLHRLIYLSALAAVVHYLWKVKVMTGSPVYYAAIAAALLAFRVVWAIRKSGARAQVVEAK